jgi:ribosomal protein S18 acetylase RimI-like enzyme
VTAIVPLLLHHCPEVAGLHLNHLRTGFRGRPGLRLLQTYYTALVQSAGACGFVAEEERTVIGYVCGVWKPTAVRATLLKDDWPSLAFWGMAQMLICPHLAADLVRRLQGAAKGSRSTETGYELRPIVVAPAARGSGIAAQLTNVLLADAARRGFTHVYLFAEEDNATANAFYRKVGFRLSGQKIEAGIVYLQYEYLFSTP